MEFTFEVGAKEIGSEPLEASLVVVLVLRVYLGGARLEGGIRPSAAGILNRFLLVIVLRVGERSLRLVRVLVGEAGVQHLGVLCAEGQWQVVPDGVEEDVVSQNVTLY